MSALKQHQQQQQQQQQGKGKKKQKKEVPKDADGFYDARARLQQTETKEDIDALLNSLPLLADNVAEEDIPEFEMLQAIADEVTPKDRAESFKKSGNMAFRLGPSRWEDAIIYYSQGIDANCDDPEVNGALFNNRGLVHMRRKNYGRALKDFEEALKWQPNNVKALHRAATVCNYTSKMEKALDYIERAHVLEDVQPKIREQVEKLHGIITKKIADLEEKERIRQEKEAEAARKVEAVQQLCRSRGFRLRDSDVDLMRRYDTKLYFDDRKKLHMSAVFLYPEFMQSDFIQDVSEEHRLRDHLNIMFPPNAPYAPWDTNRQYTASNVELYVEGTGKHGLLSVKPSNLLTTLLTNRRYALPHVLVVFVIAKNSPHRNDFLAQYNKNKK